MDAILEAAARIIRQQGAEALTTNLISEVAGVGVATLYGYFPNRTAILVTLARRLMSEDEAVMISAVQGARDGQAIRAAIRALIRRHRDDAAVRRAVMSIHHGQGLATEHAQAAQRTIGRLMAGGELSSMAPDHLRLFVLTRAILGVARAVVEEGPPASDQGLEDELVNLAELYLRGPGPPTTAA